MSDTFPNRAFVLTPPGAGAIALIRLVGPDALSLVGRVFHAQQGGPLTVGNGNRLRYGRFMDGKETVDDVIVSLAPTVGAPTIDISAHGGVRVVERILQVLAQLGASVGDAEEACSVVWPASDTIEREALDALSKAKTERAVRFLVWQGKQLVRELLRVAALCVVDPQRAGHELNRILAGFSTARTLIEGAAIAIVGPPNSGKSTLFNRLVGHPATLVSPQAGTTRDWVTQTVDVEGIPLTLVDTAGLRGSAEPLEQLAADAGRRVAHRASIRLLVLDGSQPLTPDLTALVCASCSSPGVFLVLNKMDVACAWDPGDLPSETDVPKTAVLRISAKEGDGVADLIDRVLASLGFDAKVGCVPTVFTERQRQVMLSILSDLPERPEAAQAGIKHRLIGC